jgi:hypothetical protein
MEDCMANKFGIKRVILAIVETPVGKPLVVDLSHIKLEESDSEVKDDA